MIKPTNGRIVEYIPNGDFDVARHNEQPLTAQICCVWGDRMVNLLVTDHNGDTHKRTSVMLLQPGDTPPVEQRYCQWMDYQLGQAARTERAEAAAGVGRGPLPNEGAVA